MAFTNVWDETKPAGTRDVNLGDDDIREFKLQVRERLAIDHSISGTDDANTGYHKKVTLLEQGSDPASLADALYLYAKLSGSYSELFTRHENAGVIQLTRLGKLWIESLGLASEAQGDVLYHNGTIWTRLGAGSSGQFLKTQGTGANPTWAAVSGSYVNGAFKNLKVVRTSATIVTLTADEVLVDDGAGTVQRITSVSKTGTITVSGAGGLDTGAEAANTIYYVWLIAKADGTHALLLSASSSSPTMPSGYTYKTLLSCVGNDNSSNFINFTQQGRRYVFATSATLASGNAGTGAWTTVDLTPANMSTNAGFVPSALSDLCW